jgi:type I restriction enzyme S subunit
VKKGWHTRTLEDACQFSNGLWKGEKPPFVKIGVIRNTNFTKEGTLNDSDIAYLDVEAKKLEKRRLAFGDIILEKSGGGPKQPVGRVALFDKTEGDFSFSNFTAALRVRDPLMLDFRFVHKFLHWTYLSGITEGMQSHSTGIRNLDGDAYKAIKISFPPLPEQKRIVAILDEAFEGIDTAVANTEKNLANARELFDSYIKSVFAKRGEGWAEKNIGAICENLDSRRVPITKSERVKGEIPYYGASGIVDYVSGHLFDEDILLISEDGANLIARTYPIAFSVVGKSWVNNHAHVVRFSRLETQKIVELYLNSISLAPYVSGMAQPKLNQKSLNAIAIPVPPIAEQARIVETAEMLRAGVKRLEAIDREKLVALANLRQAILRKAFAGELTEQPDKALREAAE